MKKTLSVFLLLATLIIPRESFCRITANTVFDLYDLGPIDPQQVNGTGYVTGHHRVTGETVLWTWDMDREGGVSFGTNAYPRVNLIGGEFLAASPIPPYESYEGIDIGLGHYLSPWLTPSYVFGTVRVSGSRLRGYLIPYHDNSQNTFRLLPTVDGADMHITGTCYDYDRTLFGSLLMSDHQSRAITISLSLNSSTQEVVASPPTSLNYLSERFPTVRNNQITDCSSEDFVGTYQVDEGRTRSFMYMRGVTTSTRPITVLVSDLGDLGGSSTWVKSVVTEDTGTAAPWARARIVGSSMNVRGFERAFLIDHYEIRQTFVNNRMVDERVPVMTELGALSESPWASSSANGINTDGIVVGYSRDPWEPNQKAMIYIPGTGLRDLNNLLRESNDRASWTLKNATAISKNNDYIVGKATYQPVVRAWFGGRSYYQPVGASEERGFLLIPSADPTWNPDIIYPYPSYFDSGALPKSIKQK